MYDTGTIDRVAKRGSVYTSEIVDRRSYTYIYTYIYDTIDTPQSQCIIYKYTFSFAINNYNDEISFYLVYS